MFQKKFKVLLPLLLLVTIDAMGIGIIFPILSPIFMSPNTSFLPIHISSGWRDLYYALALGLFACFMFFATPVLGTMSDQFGRKRILLFCLFGTALSSFMCAWGIAYKSIFLLMFGRVIAGITSGSQPIAQAAIIDLSSAEDKTKNLGLVAFVGCLGFVLGPMLGGFFSDSHLVGWFDYKMPFIVDGLVAIINGILLIFSFTDITTIKKQVKIKLNEPLKIFVEAMTQKSIRQLSVILLLYETAWALYFQYISIFLLQRYHFQSSGIGLYMSYIAVILGVTFLGIIRLLLRYFKEREIVQVGLWCSGIMMLFPLLFHSLFAQWLIIVPLTIGIGLVWNAILALFSNAVDKDRQGWAMGVSSAVVSISWIIGSFLTGALDYINVFFPFAAAGIFMLFAAVMITRYRQVNGKH